LLGRRREVKPQQKIRFPFLVFVLALQWCNASIRQRSNGGVAEWLCSGLQSRVRRFDPDPRLQLSVSGSQRPPNFIVEKSYPVFRGFVFFWRPAPTAIVPIKKLVSERREN
jgi:hypothetical protein